MKIATLTNAMVAVAGLLLVQTACAAEAVTSAAEMKIPLKAQPFDLQQVRLLDGPFKEAQELNRKYLISLDPDRFLFVFRKNVGLQATAKPYEGWDSPKSEQRGAMLGHYLTACAQMYASTGDDEFKRRVDYIIGELAKCQEASPAAMFNPGYLSAFPESFIDRWEKRRSVWAPYYALHKIMAGLFDANQLCGNAQSLTALTNMANWVKFRVDRLTHEQMQQALGAANGLANWQEYGGMNEVLANLYGVTGNPEHLRLARAFNHDVIFTPLAGGKDQLNGIHANTTIPKIIGAAREYELTGETQFKNIAQNFWNFVALNRSYCIGGHGDKEHYFPVTDFGKHLGTDTSETCGTYNMLKLTRQLFAWEPSVELMDFYERGLYNNILSAQDPRTGNWCYFAPMKPGHFKSYSTLDHSFWCCVGTGMEHPTKFADTIFMHHADTLYVNLFIAAELTWKEKGVVVRQETNFPESDTVRLRFKCEKPVKLTVKVRRPSWTEKPGYVDTTREWRDGDTLDIHHPMTLRVEPLPGEPKTVALMYGPIVLAGELGTQGMPNPYTGIQIAFSNVPTPSVPTFVCDAKDLPAHIERVDGQPLKFRTKGIGHPSDVALIPFYRMHHQRYSVYWNLCTAEEAAKLVEAEATRKAAEARIVDEVHLATNQSEVDHNMQGERTNVGSFRNLPWRAAQGWFSYEMKLPAERPVTLRCTYWGSDVGKRTFDVLANGQKIAEQTLNNNKPGKFFDVDYALPDDLIKDKQEITIRFQAHPGHTAGGLYGLQMLKP